MSYAHTQVAQIAAISSNRCIGKNNELPWHISADLQHFKQLTTANHDSDIQGIVIMGRKTFESMGALPNRKYAVVTRSGWTSNDDNVVVFQSIEEAMDRLAEFTGHVIVSGGGEIYRETLPMASTLHLSTIDIEPEGDVFFPSIPNTFEVVFEQHFTSNINYCYQIWKKG